MEQIQRVNRSDATVTVSGGAVVAGPGLTVATIHFLALDGDQYLFRGAPCTHLCVTYQQALENYIVNDLNGLISAADYPEGDESHIPTDP